MVSSDLDCFAPDARYDNLTSSGHEKYGEFAKSDHRIMR